MSTYRFKTETYGSFRIAFLTDLTGSELWKKTLP